MTRAAAVAEPKGMYHFRMTWRLDAPIDRVWEMLSEPERWPQYWRNCRDVTRLEQGDAEGVGTLQQFTMQTQLPYRLVFRIRGTRAERPRLIEGAVEGNLEGTVRWEIDEQPDGTEVRYFWDVRPTKPWMVRLTPLLRPVFVWNHRAMMRNAARGLPKMIGARITAQRYF